MVRGQDNSTPTPSTMADPLPYRVLNYSAFHNLFSLYCSKWSGNAMKKLENEKVTQLFHWTQSTLGGNEKVGRFYFFFSFYWTHCWAGVSQGLLKRALKGSEQGKNLAFCLTFFFHLSWTHCWSAAGQLKEWGNTFFFVYLFWTAADVQQNEKVSAKTPKTTFFHWTELPAWPRRMKKKGYETHCRPGFDVREQGRVFAKRAKTFWR